MHPATQTLPKHLASPVHAFARRQPLQQNCQNRHREHPAHCFALRLFAGNASKQPIQFPFDFRPRHRNSLFRGEDLFWRLTNCFIIWIRRLPRKRLRKSELKGIGWKWIKAVSQEKIKQKKDYILKLVLDKIQKITYNLFCSKFCCIRIVKQF